ncbi:MAG TPA: hypothetical protein VHM26_19115, partial [Chitinophagaceae bacterium]|nr:hypothetical protein [Chitinophagaceae bacterium]
MKQQLKLATLAVALLMGGTIMAQEVKTIFKSKRLSSGGYGAATNRFTTIRGKYANLSGFYGGWFVDKRLMIGLGAAASTNNLRVPDTYSTDPTDSRTWQYGQFGLMTEYVIGSNKPIHLVIQAFGGAGFTLQYSRHDWHIDETATDKNWFVVAEPGIQLEMNLFKWMRVSPGVTYRKT